MSKIVIKLLSTPSELAQVREIFFESSTRKVFENENAKEDFYWKYVGLYVAKNPGLVFVACNKDVLGYCLGMPLSSDNALLEVQPHLKMFEDLFSTYPAHLHINCRADARGQGIGKSLIIHMEKQLQQMNITGLHIITSSDARNRFFYSQLGYSFEAQRESMLFMGKKL